MFEEEEDYDEEEDIDTFDLLILMLIDKIGERKRKKDSIK